MSGMRVELQIRYKLSIKVVSYDHHIINHLREGNEGNRVVLAEVRNKTGEFEPLEDDTVYKVAITNFLTLPG